MCVIYTKVQKTDVAKLWHIGAIKVTSAIKVTLFHGIPRCNVLTIENR